MGTTTDRTRLWRLVALFLLAAAFASVPVIWTNERPAAAIPGCAEDSTAPICNRGPIVDAPFAAPANGFVWWVPDRFTGTVAGFHWNPVTRSYNAGHVHPTTWPAHFYACRTAEDEELSSSGQATANTYTWTIAGQTVVQQSCFLSRTFPRQGSYDVRLTVTGPNAAGPFAQTVTIRDILIVSIGDSYASGEGNPDVARNGDQAAQWVDWRCHRSAKSGPAQAARSLEVADPHTSVTFLSFACSGATINTPDFGHSDDPWITDEKWYDPFRPGDPTKPKGTGILGSYRGVEPADSYGDHMPAQVEQMRVAVGERRVDALLVSGGGNDVGFGQLIEACVKHADCTTAEHLVTSSPEAVNAPAKVTVPQRFEQGRLTLAGKYKQLADKLGTLTTTTGVPVRIAKTYITEYPDPTTQRDASGNVVLCDEIVEDIGWAIGSDIAGAEIGWSHKTVLPELNRAVAEAATAHGWTHVGGIHTGFHGHGYCVGDSDKFPNDSRWFRTAAEAAALQGPNDRGKTTGTMHPTTTGLRFQADRLLDHLRPGLAPLPIDAGPTKVAVNDVSVVEGHTATKSVTFTITRSGDTSAGSSVQWATANGTAAAGSDYVAASGRADFGIGQTSQPVTVNVIGDTAAEANETFYVKLSSPVGTSIADGTGVGTITNDDTPAFSINDVSVTEGDEGTQDMTFTITRSSSATASSVYWATANDTATAPSDYTAVAPTRLDFVAGQATRTVTVPVVGDTMVEPAERFYVKLTSPTGAVIADDTGVGTIVNNDTIDRPPSCYTRCDW